MTQILSLSINFKNPYVNLLCIGCISHALAVISWDATRFCG